MEFSIYEESNPLTGEHRFYPEFRTFKALGAPSWSRYQKEYPHSIPESTYHDIYFGTLKEAEEFLMDRINKAKVTIRHPFRTKGKGL